MESRSSGDEATNHKALWVAGRLAAIALVIVVALALALPVMHLGISRYDEGLIALGAEQVLKGRHPNIDFYSPYPPGVYYTLAALFHMAGIRLLVERMLGVGLVTACVAFGCLLVTGLRPPSRGRLFPELALAVVTMSIAALGLGTVGLSPVTSGSLCLVFLGALILRASLPRGNPLAGFATGAVFGLAALWRADFGLYGAVAAGVVWLFRAGRPAAGDRERSGWWRLWGAVALGMGAGAVVVPTFGALMAVGGERAFRSLVVWPILSSSVAALPWPPLVPVVRGTPLAERPPMQQVALLCQHWIFYFPLAAAALGLWRIARWRALTSTEINVGLWLLLVSAGFSNYASVRTDYYHLLPLFFSSLLFVALCMGGALSERSEKHPSLRFGWLAIGWVLTIPALAALVPTTLAQWTADAIHHTRRMAELPARRAAGITPIYRTARQYGELLRYLSVNVPAGERIYSGTARHDVYQINDVMIYFLAERDPGTYFWCLDAGVTTTREVQEQMLNELRANGVNTMVRWREFTQMEPNAASRKPGSTWLDQVLGVEFAHVVSLEPYEVWRRVNIVVPARPP